MKRATMLSIFLLVCGASAASAQRAYFYEIMQHYEPIRLALFEDSTEGVAPHAEAIAEDLLQLQAAFTPEEAGVAGGNSELVKEKLPEVIAAAEALAAAESLQAARDAFAGMSKPLIEWHAKLVMTPRPVVVDCPMFEHSWLQPEDEAIGNPYGDVPPCGDIVAR